MTENKTAQLALGKLWDKGKDTLSTQLKKVMEESDENYPSLADFALDPLKMRNHLEKYVRDVLARVLVAEDEISEQITDPQRKYNAIENLIEAPFLSMAPVKSLAGARTAEEMELSFYMQYLLTIDYVSHGHHKYKTMKGNWSSGIVVELEEADFGISVRRAISAGGAGSGKCRLGGLRQGRQHPAQADRRACKAAARRNILPAGRAHLAQHAASAPS